MKSARALSSVAITGGYSDVWPVCAMLAACLPPQIAITLFLEEQDSADYPIVIPAAHRLLELLKISPRDLIGTAGAAVSLGTDHIGWRGTNSAFFAAPSGKLPTISGVDIHHIMLRAAMQHQDTERLGYLLEPFRFPALVAKGGKFAWAGARPDSPTSLLGPQVHCSARAFASALEKRIPPGRIQTAPCDPEDSDALGADLTIDCSHRPARRSGRIKLFESGMFPFDRLATLVHQEASESARWSPSAQALDGGLLIKTPTTQGIFSQLFFTAERTAQGQVDRHLGPDSTTRAFSLEADNQPWIDNRIHMGRASASLGPYMWADGLLLFEQILKLAELLPARTTMRNEAEAFNAAHRQTCTQLLDRVLMPFVLNSRTDGAWKALRQLQQPESLRIRLDQFAGGGRIARFEGELFDEQSWIDLQIGFGVVPQRCTPRALALDMHTMVPVLRRMANDFAARVDTLPIHQPPFTD